MPWTNHDDYMKPDTTASNDKLDLIDVRIYGKRRVRFGSKYIPKPIIENNIRFHKTYY